VQIQLSEKYYLTSSPQAYELSEMTKKGLRAFKYFSSLESCFKEYLNMKIKNSKTVEFSELVLLHIEAIKEIKKCVRMMQNGRISTNRTIKPR